MSPNPVLIECKIKRTGGSVVDLPDPTAAEGVARYHFKDDGFGHHIAPVANEGHVAALLAIPEGYKLFMSAADPGIAMGAAKPVDPAPTTAPPTAPPTAPELTQTDTAPPTQAGSTDAELDAARVEYERVFGVPARNNAKLETIQAKLAAHKG